VYIPISYDQDFDDLWMHLKSKYPEKLFDIDGLGKQLDMMNFTNEFFSEGTTCVADVSIDANANVDDKTVISYNHELPKPFMKLNSYYMLWKEIKRLYDRVTADEIIEKQVAGDIYINDVHGIASAMPYCFNYSTYDIMTKGLPMIKKIKSIPPKYLYSFKSQVEQFTIIAANSTLGATGLADFLLVMSYYVEKMLETKSDAHFKFETEEDCWRYVEENLRSFIYTINQPTRANQSCFTNLSIYDNYFLADLKNSYIFEDGSLLNIDIVNKMQEMFLRIMCDELHRTPITFPVLTACFSIDEENNIKDEEFAKMIAHYNKEYGNINLYCGSSSTLSSCCRLRSDRSSEYFNSFGAGSTKIGSLGVCTINLPRLAFKNKYNVDRFIDELREMVKVCAQVNNAKRKIVERRIGNHHPLYSLGFMDISKQYSTVGINGFNEAIEILGENILDERGQELGIKIIDTINSENDKHAKQYNAPHNCEQIPGESVSVKLATKDRLLKYNKEYEMYSNQFIPLTTNADMLDRIKLQGIFDKKFTGGAICHINVETEIEDEQKIVDLIKYCAKQGVVYWAINYNLQECENSHLTVGRNQNCTICGKPIINNYTRVVGFLTNVKNWNPTRRTIDYPNRVFYKDV
jgi:ribonucleoside-triphosphate reductase